MTIRKEDEIRAIHVDLKRAAMEAVNALRDSYKVACANIPGFEESANEEHLFNELIEYMIRYHQEGNV